MSGSSPLNPHPEWSANYSAPRSFGSRSYRMAGVHFAANAGKFASGGWEVATVRIDEPDIAVYDVFADRQVVNAVAYGAALREHGNTHVDFDHLLDGLFVFEFHGDAGRHTGPLKDALNGAADVARFRVTDEWKCCE